MTYERHVRLVTVCAAIAVLGIADLSAREIHVAKTGADSASGSDEQPYLTINHAAGVAQPGDTVKVHAGTYREWVKPVRGGTGEDNRIIYRAAPSEDVVITGSERIATWTSEVGGVWQVELPYHES